LGTPAASRSTGLNVHLPAAKAPTTRPRVKGAVVLFEHGPHQLARARLPE